METKVKLRESKQMKEVVITSTSKPVIIQSVLEKWQLIINNVAQIFEVPAALIMKITQDNMEVFLKSQNRENPYPEDGYDSLGHGLYCETVIGEDRELIVENSLENEAWKDNPDVALDMISYLGYPIQWADGETFGTICALDNKTNHYDEKYRHFLRLMKSLIEDDLELLTIQQHLEEISNTDELTGIYNRRYGFGVLSQLSAEYERYNRPFSIMMLDIDDFKQVNDTFGHHVGDQTLIEFVNTIIPMIRTVDIFVRLGGDEFLLICRETTKKDMNFIGKKLQKAILNNIFFDDKNIAISYGIADSIDGSNAQELLQVADKNMYKMKRSREKH